jgi:outer membrane immunogenic protein
MFNPIDGLTVTGISVMKKFVFLLAISTAALVPAVAAVAADLDVPPPPPPTEELRQATYDWTGAYVGAWAGATCVEGNLTETRTAPLSALDWENSGCGWKGGVMAGYNHQFDNFVLGLEADWGKTGSIAENETVVDANATADFAFSMDHIVTGRVRAGYAWDDTLFYTTGGIAWAKGDISSIHGSGPEGLKGSHWGWSFGGGVEHAFTDQLRLRLEYIFTKFKGDDYSEACCNVAVEDFDDHEVKVGLIWAF